ncbi:MAG: hypothetical protein AB1714_31650 [Acidobacteriota bacterium]
MIGECREPRPSMSRASRLRALISTVAAASVALMATAAAPGSREKEFPTVRVLWKSPGQVDTIHAIGDTVFLAGCSHVTAAKARDGSVLWEKDYSIGDSDSEGVLKVLDGLLVLCVDDTLVRIDPASGEALQKIEVGGEVYDNFAGLPLVVYAGLKEGNRFLSYDIRAGKELARFDPGIKDDHGVFRFVQGVLIYQDTRDPQTLVGLDPVKLKEIWRRKYDTQVCFKTCNGQLGLRLGPPEWEEGFAYFDPRTGQLGARLPRRQLAYSHSHINRDMDWELDAEDPTEVPEQTLHRYAPTSGDVVWSLKIDGHITSANLVRDTLIIGKWGNGTGDRWRDHVLIVDRSTGKLLNEARTPAPIWGILDFGDFLVVRSLLVGWSAYAFSLHEFDPPDAVFRCIEE